MRALTVVTATAESEIAWPWLATQLQPDMDFETRASMPDSSVAGPQGFHLQAPDLRSRPARELTDAGQGWPASQIVCTGRSILVTKRP
jgi:hypothetical protein